VVKKALPRPQKAQKRFYACPTQRFDFRLPNFAISQAMARNSAPGNLQLKLNTLSQGMEIAESIVIFTREDRMFNKIVAKLLVLLISSPVYAAGYVEVYDCVKDRFNDWELLVRVSPKELKTVDFATRLSCQETISFLNRGNFQGKFCACDTSIGIIGMISSAWNKDQSVVPFDVNLRCYNVANGDFKETDRIDNPFSKSAPVRQLEETVAECNDHRIKENSNKRPLSEVECAGWLTDKFIEKFEQDQLYFDRYAQLQPIDWKHPFQRRIRYVVESRGNPFRIKVINDSYDSERVYTIHYDSTGQLLREAHREYFKYASTSARQLSQSDTIKFETKNGKCMPMSWDLVTEGRQGPIQTNFFNASKCMSEFQTTGKVPVSCWIIEDFLKDKSLWSR